MRLKTRSLYLSVAMVLLVAFIFNSCKKAEIESYEKTVTFYAKYKNPSGQNQPIMLLDTINLPAILKIKDKYVDEVGNRIKVSFGNVKLSDGLGLYVVEDAKTEEKRNGEWEVDQENFLKAEVSQSVDLVLVLDVSTSLGDDVENVRTYAIDFIYSIKEQIPNSKIGIVIFSDSIYSSPLEDDISNLETFINTYSYQGQDATKLYEAMYTGVDVLSTSTAESKNIVTFTDGRNNAWSDLLKFETSDTIEARLNKPLDGTSINSFLIGLDGKGGVDKEELSRLVANGGISSFPKDAVQLEKVFQKVANSVANVYSFVYDRNNSPIEQWKELKFTLNIKLQ